VIQLLFKDGTPVGPDELSKWLQAVEEDPETDEDQARVARILVSYVRAKAN
jgi:hypothetical protein